MKKTLSMILAVMMALGLAFTAYASEASEASEVTLDEIVAQIEDPHEGGKLK